MGARVHARRGGRIAAAYNKQLAAARRRRLWDCIEALESRRLLSNGVIVANVGDPHAPPPRTVAPATKVGEAAAQPIGPQASYWIGDERVMLTQRADRLLVGAEEGMNLTAIKEMLIGEALSIADDIGMADNSTLFIDPAGSAAATVAAIANAAIPGIAWVVPTFTVAGTGAEIGVGNE